MVKTISIYDFRDAFKAAGRGEQFSYDGLEVIFDYIESYEQDSGEQTELDVIALCCEWAEDTVENIIRNYSIDCDDVEDDEIQNYVIEYLEDNTAHAMATDAGDIVYVQF